MNPPKPKRTASPAMQNRLSELEEQVALRGIQIHYDLLEAAGLKLKDGMCKINGEYHLFIDRRKSMADRIEILESYLDRPIPDDLPSKP
jgi:hypothetical protein